MKIEQIEVTISRDGKVRVQTSGFSGDECLQATEELEALLGGQVMERQPTAEAFESTDLKQTEKLKIHR